MNTFHDRPFYTFLREERQFSFLLGFFLMQKGDAISRFLDLVRQRQGPSEAVLQTPSTDALDKAEVYVEYTYLRDRWDSLKTGVERPQANQAKRDFIDVLLRRIPSLVPLCGPCEA